MFWVKKFYSSRKIISFLWRLSSGNMFYLREWIFISSVLSCNKCIKCCFKGYQHLYDGNEIIDPNPLNRVQQWNGCCPLLVFDALGVMHTVDAKIAIVLKYCWSKEKFSGHVLRSSYIHVGCWCHHTHVNVLLSNVALDKYLGNWGVSRSEKREEEFYSRISIWL